MGKRIYGKEVDIDIQQVKKFWDERSKKYDDKHPYVTVKFNDNNPEFAEKWDKYEKVQVLPHMKINEDSRVLDIGCGIGRLTEVIVEECKYYMGVDFSSDLIEIAKSRIYMHSECEFLAAAFQDINRDNEVFRNIERFNKVIIAGVLLYINDRDINECLNNLLDIIDKKCTIYISSPVALKDRLTLSDWESDQFNIEYNAIYRSIEEYEILFQPLLDSGFKIIHKDFFLRDDNSHSDTARHYFILNRN